jgi:hemerythrin-like domain-containing protein
MKDSADYPDSRRSFLRGAAALAGVAVLLGPARVWGAPPEKAQAPGEEKFAEVTATEDLMREHGVLRRIMLIYDELAARLARGAQFPLTVLVEASDIIRRFIQDYHEKDEENYLFPRFEKAGRLVDLVQVLRRQHEAGRKLIDRVKTLATAESLPDRPAGLRLANDLQLFNRMYRPHAAREDTVLYPAFHDIVSAKEFDGIGDKFEDEEQRLFGKEGFERMVARVADLEKSLGLYELAQFTPKV